MRLLRCTGDLPDNATPQLEEFYGNVPDYAILSHRWGKPEEEISFADLISGSDVSHKHGYAKVMGAYMQARNDQIDYVWIDTCCIDKSSSSELSEAINSMFAWYKGSAVCMVYLEDVVGERLADLYGGESLFRSSEWFTRGTYLSEHVIFYDKTWDVIGSRNDLASLISEITRIDINVLRKRADEVVTASVARRMSWAAVRKTTREEDRAYSLMGLFGVNMAPLYGEGGEKSFLRLQEEIMRRSTDHSLFAWVGEGKNEMSGLLARSVDYFSNSGDVVPIDYNEYAAKFNITSPSPEFLQTNFGTRIQLPLELLYPNYECRAHLACISQGSASRETISIHLIRFPGAAIETYERIDSGPLEFSHIKALNQADIAVKQIYVTSLHNRGIFESKTNVIEIVFQANDPDYNFMEGELENYKFMYCTGPSTREEKSEFNVLFPRVDEVSFVAVGNITILGHSLASPPSNSVSPDLIQVFFIVGVYQGRIWTDIHQSAGEYKQPTAAEVRGHYIDSESRPGNVRKLHRRSTSLKVGNICYRIDVSEKNHPDPTFESYLAIMSFTETKK